MNKFTLFSLIKLLLYQIVSTILRDIQVIIIPGVFSLGLLSKPHFNTSRFGLDSVVYKSIDQWNELQLIYPDSDLTTLSKIELINICKGIIFNNYWLYTSVCLYYSYVYSYYSHVFLFTCLFFIEYYYYYYYYWWITC